jgi:hypothetical protein
VNGIAKQSDDAPNIDEVWAADPSNPGALIDSREVDRARLLERLFEITMVS